MKLWTLTTFCAASLLLLSGCGGVKPKPNDMAVVDSTLPVVTLTENGTFVDMNAVAFEWQSIKDTRVKGIYIYKQTMDKTTLEEEYYDTVKNRFTTHYVDTKITPNMQYSYYFKTFSNDAESKKSDVVVVNALPVLESVSWIHSIQSMPRSAKIIWRPHINQKVKAYIIERRTLKEDKWDKIETVSGRLSAEFIDDKLEDNYVYKYRIRVLTYDDIISNPSEVVSVVTKALPRDITDIRSTRDLPKKIQLTWAPTDIKDFLTYNVYRSDDIDGSYKTITNTRHNEFIDLIDEDGKNYFYRVSVTDKDGLESNSKTQSIQGQTLPEPAAPSLVEAKLIDNKIVLNWHSADERTKSYIVTKRGKKSWFDAVDEEFVDISGNSFIDSMIEPETTYYYQVISVDKYSIKSKPSIEVMFTTTKTQGKVIDQKIKESRSVEVKKSASKVNETSVVKPMQDMNLNEL